MVSIMRLVLTNFEVLPIQLKRSVTYFSVLLFTGLVVVASISVKNYISDTMSITLVEPELFSNEEQVPEETSSTILVKKGDTLKSILRAQNIPNIDVSQIIEASKGISSLKIGQQITFDYEMKIVEDDDNDLATETRTLTKLTVAVDKLNSIEIIRENNRFVSKTATIPLKKYIAKSSTVIEPNFIEALKKLGLSVNTIVELVNAYSYQIDFQRQIQPGDTFSVITEKFFTEDGNFSHHGKVLYASLVSSGKNYNIYRYCPDGSNNHGFFSEDGKTVKRSLLRTPVSLVRISSHYGNRKHPTLGFTKMHRGVDFAAPTGTPIYAAGDGVVTEIGWKSGYGKIVQIKHSPTLSTTYAHASRFAKNLKYGSIVKQGQVIAYVGQTGRTTGAHLHYEVKVDGKHVNPMSIKTTPGAELSGKNLAEFQKLKNKIKIVSKQLEQNLEIADNDALLMN